MAKKKDKEIKPSKAVLKRVLDYKLKSISHTRKDIKDWTMATNMVNYVEEPSNYMLQELLNVISNDGHLTSQRQNLKDQIFSSPFTIYHDDKEDDGETRLLRNSSGFKKIIGTIHETDDYAYSVIELSLNNKKLVVDVVPRANIIPQNGTFLEDYTNNSNKINYREIREFGTWILEFNKLDISQGDLGLLNKLVPHVLMKRFAQSCWSELCEIYGIPPRVLKTNTADTGMMNRGEEMMRDMGAAAWFIIDEAETLEFATGATTNGDVYRNLINLCTNEISLVIIGAVVGQDTTNGSRSKEEAAQELLWIKAQARMSHIEQEMNETVMPVLAKIGLIKEGAVFKYNEAEDTNKLFEYTKAFLNDARYFIPVEFIKEKFGVELIEVETKEIDETKNKGGQKLNAKLPDNFFD
ncbi:hypothetical protein KO02_17510 [Sphingobacterium sp. ML3W]|uniref:phage portal protein family protein n=1 Tax=Sphingobacterium sp. ML3W TaxID=1538644 RepID=UPI0004F5AAA4|nr:DUF935 family protein [Sphingobacterium sp. ML3W]AIM38281.1 hypothetical protein KO02_17510 [Sphingobacterium sp. ML3W]